MSVSISRSTKLSFLEDDVENLRSQVAKATEKLHPYLHVQNLKQEVRELKKEIALLEELDKLNEQITKIKLSLEATCLHSPAAKNDPSKP